MFFSQIPTNRGIIKMIVLIVIALLILSYFGYNLRTIVNSPNTQDNFSYVGGAIANVWNNYLKAPASYLWDIFINFIWNPAIHNIQNTNNSQMINTQQAQPLLPNPIR